MQMFLSVVVRAALAVESHKQLTEHVKGGHARTANREEPDAPMIIGSGQPKYLVLGKETREGRETCDGEHGNKKRGESDRHPLLEAAHFAHVLLMVHGMDHAAGSEEQAGFEEGVS